MAPPDDNGIIVHSNATLALAQKESAEHMHGMDALRQNMQTRELSVKAYSLDDPNAPSGDNVKTVHFVRHGQGFHNLLADLAQQEGRQWVQVLVLKCLFPSLLADGGSPCVFLPVHQF